MKPKRKIKTTRKKWRRKAQLRKQYSLPRHLHPNQIETARSIAHNAQAALHTLQALHFDFLASAELEDARITRQLFHKDASVLRRSGNSLVKAIALLERHFKLRRSA